MIKRIKDMAWSMKLAVIFLLTCYITLFYFAPAAAAGFTLVNVLAAAIVRVINYCVDGR